MKSSKSLVLGSLMTLLFSLFCHAQYQEILPAAENGDAFSQLVMGNAYVTGSGIEKNYTKAFIMYERAAKQNQPAAQNGLAYCYEMGYGVQQSYAKAFYWYKKSAENGLARSQYELGLAYSLGRGCELNKELAIFWLRKACENTHDKACEMLNTMKSK